MVYFLTGNTATISIGATPVADGGGTDGITLTTIIIASACFFVALMVIVIVMTVLVAYCKKCVNPLPGGEGDDRRITIKRYLNYTYYSLFYLLNAYSSYTVMIHTLDGQFCLRYPNWRKPIIWTCHSHTKDIIAHHWEKPSLCYGDHKTMNYITTLELKHSLVWK